MGGNWLRKHERGNGKVATIGWCFGGGWSLNASLAAPVDATVVYYGNVAKKTDQLTSLKGPVLGHFATKDKWINQKMIDGYRSGHEGCRERIRKRALIRTHGPIFGVRST